MSSVCALTEDIHKIVNLDKQHALLASIQCHSHTTISLAMLNPALTVQIHSNTTISLNILAPTLLARLLQYPNVNSLASSPSRNNFRSRSQRIWCRTQSVLQVLTNGRRGEEGSRRNHQHESRRKTAVDGLPMRTSWYAPLKNRDPSSKEAGATGSKHCETSRTDSAEKRR